MIFCVCIFGWLECVGLCLCRPLCIFERCLDSNLESCRSKQARKLRAQPSQWLWFLTVVISQFCLVSFTEILCCTAILKSLFPQQCFPPNLLKLFITVCKGTYYKNDCLKTNLRSNLGRIDKKRPKKRTTSVNWRSFSIANLLLLRVIGVTNAFYGFGSFKSSSIEKLGIKRNFRYMGTW